MSSFEPNKRHLQTYGEAALSDRNCHEWFQKFKNGEFDIEDKERSRRPKVYEDAKLEALLDQDSKDGKKSGKRWTILQIKRKLPLFHNKCLIFDKKRRKLICTPDNTIKNEESSLISLDINNNLKHEIRHKVTNKTSNILKRLNDNEFFKYKLHNNQLTLTNIVLAKCYGLPNIHKQDTPLHPYNFIDQ